MVIIINFPSRQDQSIDTLPECERSESRSEWSSINEPPEEVGHGPPWSCD